MPSADIVFLIPGFLGFERAGNFGNFADRVCAALRTQLEAKREGAVLVLPLGSLPTTSFAERQRTLLEMLSRQLIAHPGVERIHLVGHSVGGVDAHLLTCRDALERGVWSTIDPHGVRAKIRTVVSIAAPHGGTYLAAAPGAGSLTLRALIDDPGGALAMVQLVNKLFASALHDVGPRPSAGGLFREGRKVRHFMAELMRWQSFLHALTPDAMESLYASAMPLPEVKRRSFVTMAGRPLSGARGSDDFFEELSRRTSGGGNGFTRHPTRIRDAVAQLRAALDDPKRLIVSQDALPPAHVDGQTNDGVANAARQLIDPEDPSELSAVVIADHFDVLGYYDRGLNVSELEPVEASAQVSGLLHSGSCFRDSEFFALYRRVADAISEESAQNQPAASPEPVPEKSKRVRSGGRTPSRRPTA